MQTGFRTKLMLVMIVFSVIISFTISYIDIERVKDKLTVENDKKLSLIEKNIVTALRAVDNALFLFDDNLAAKMEANTQILLEKYQENPDFTTWDFHALSQQFEMDIYIINKENIIIYTNYPEDLTLEFSECCVEFSKLLHQRRVTGEFYHDGMDIQQQTGGLKKFSYQGTHDHQYIIELGVDLEEHEILKRYDFLDTIRKLEEDYPMVDVITIFNDEGFRLGRTSGEVRIQNKYMKHLVEAMTENKKVFVEEKVGNGIIRSLYIPYEAEETRGSSTTRVIEIIYNTNELDEMIKQMNSVFILQSVVTLCISVLASMIISFIIATPMHLAFHDSLTGLRNRASYETLLRKGIYKRKMVGLLLMDLDNFKNVNDQLGHDTGDRLLKYVAKILTTVTRKNCTPFRLGGDEFVIVVENLNDHKKLEAIANKIIDEIAMPNRFLQDPRMRNMNEIIRGMKVTTSIGGAIFPDDGNDIEELYKHADLALYWTKEKGKNGYSYYGDIEKSQS